jgi:hypothetical protein
MENRPKDVRHSFVYEASGARSVTNITVPARYPGYAVTLLRAVKTLREH